MPSSSTPARRLRPTVLVLALVGVVGLGALLAPVDAATPRQRGIVLGVNGHIGEARQRTHQKLAAHHYGKLERKVPSGGKMISVRSDAPWRRTAAAQPGTAAYRDIVRWANTLRKRRGKIFVAFHGEPESSANNGYGTPAEFKAAFRRVVQIFRARGADNVVFTWQMTDWAFRTKSSDAQYAGRWYPGDYYVDVVGADAYNWFRCGQGQGRWTSMKTLMDPVIAFARRHDKQAMLPEFASQQGSRRATWLVAAGRYLARHDRQIAAAFYFNRPPTSRTGAGCDWTLRTDREYTALRRMARQQVFLP